MILQEYFLITSLITDNVKALYRRGKAHIGAWNEKQALEDLKRVAELDKTLKLTVEKDIQSFLVAIKVKESAQKQSLSQMFS